MFRLSRLAASAMLLAAASVVPLLAPAAHAAPSDQQALVDRARLTIADVHKDKAFGNAPELLHKARAILIVPRLYKGGFFVGGEGGDGVLLARTAHGWSQPAFYAMGSASFGLQIGLEQSEVVMFIMSQKALNAILKNQFKVGADAGLAIVTLGSTVGGATTSAVGADIVVWASSAGAYAGITLNGSIIKPSTAADRAYYGRNVTTRDILYHGGGSNAGASGLREALGG
jgi:lipid-binding SYLF domain-containing protein